MDRSTKLRLAVILLAIVGSVWYLVPSIRYYSMSESERDALQVDEPLDYAHLKQNALKLGLDLQGGMHLVLELDHGSREMPPDEVKDAIDRTLEIIRNRVDQFGVSEPLIQRAGDERIIVELPGLEDEERAKQLVRSSAFLEFKIVEGVDKLAAVVKDIDERLMAAGAGHPADSTGESGAQAKAVSAPAAEEGAGGDSSEASLEEILFPETESESEAEVKSAAVPRLLSALMVSFPVSGGSPDIAVPVENVAAFDAILGRDDLAGLIPTDVEIRYGQKIVLNDGREYRRLFLLRKASEMTGELLATASATIGTGSNPSVANQPIVNLRMTDNGADVFERLTARNVGKRLAIVLDGVVQSAPVIRQRIGGGQAVIEGIDSIDEARDLAIVLRAGALPAPIKIIEERTIGPTLGSDSIQESKVAGTIGMIVVLVFVLFYYRFAGTLASIALLLDVVLVLAALAGFQATLTLPGIAGLILTIGMAIDANVLIFERIREELETGKSIRASVDVGYERAFVTILDANVTTFITAMVLLRFGTGPIKGFAVTLGIGIVASMFTAIYLTRTLFNMYLSGRRVKRLSI